MKKDIPMITWIRDHWVQPIVNQWPFMVAYIVLVGWESVLQNPIPRWMIIFFQAWLAAAVVELLHWRIVKWLIYAVIYTLFITELVLEWHFGMYLSPTILTLLIETNSQESGEFLSTLFRQPAFGTTLACIVLLMLANIALEMLHVSRLRIQCSWLKIKSIWFKGLAALLLVSGLVFSAISYTELFSCDEMNDVDEWRSHRRNPNDVVTQLPSTILTYPAVKCSVLLNRYIISRSSPSQKLIIPNPSMSFLLLANHISRSMHHFMATHYRLRHLWMLNKKQVAFLLSLMQSVHITKPPKLSATSLVVTLWGMANTGRQNHR